ncbi:unnamed protein product [Allacma fusca]|uniref:Propionyl-CoA carboxylase n=1 Tax=Allacma fusca TaxID=39272 RepID=A0A8J2MC86_9HEXA|nr:unnamed protein product [Allacma fusca]
MVNEGITARLRTWIIIYTRGRPALREPWDTIYKTTRLDPKEPTFDKILIANRGEIAVRVIRTARKMGIKTVAVYSTADARSLHVEMADEAVCIGEPAASESYLVEENIINAIKSTGAQAVHPGYGFLSENANFVKKLEQLGVKFMGPPAAAIQGMGDKLESKRLAQRAGVNIVPGFDGEIRNDDHCLEISNQIGYPVMIKASAGGGGKGMRIANNEKEALEGFRLAKNEAKASFGDDRILIEKFVVDPRHIEIQILCDAQGNGVYLNERECSIQRRNQKVIEEAPSSFVDPELRKAMGNQALELAKAIGYTSAGTVEFLVDNNKNFYFLEMNTRLQVEHPITECITGVDLVAEMIRVAYGHPLRFEQSEIPINGWALEMRVYAEDATRNFGTPSTGRLFRYIEPEGNGVRCDSGVREGSEISVYYDPMICKLVTFGGTRDEAILRGKQALDSYVIQGVSHNIPLLRDILSEPTFVEGATDTSYLPRIYPDGFSIPQLSETNFERLQAFAAVLEAIRTLQLKQKLRSWDFVVAHGDKSAPVSVKAISDVFVAYINGKEITIPRWDMAIPTVTLEFEGEPAILQVQGRGLSPIWKIGFQGSSYELKVYPPKAYELMHIMPLPKLSDTIKELHSPMPGVVKGISVNVGDKVLKGQEVCIIEAMKMQNKLVISSDGVVGEIRFQDFLPLRFIKMSKSVGFGRGKFPINTKPGGFFMENAPIPPCWAAATSSSNQGDETREPASVDTVDASVKVIKAPTWESTVCNGSKSEELGVDIHSVNREFEVDIKGLNPEEKLEVGNHEVTEYQKEDSEKLDAQATENSEEVRSFTFTKLHFDPKLSQDKRREHILNWQKRRRDELVDKIRHFENDNWSDDEMDESNDFVKIQEKRRQGDQQWAGRYQTRPTNRRWNDHARVMMSEWMTAKPDDFEADWIGVMCPVGLRCLIIASRGKTRVVTRRGYFIGEFQSRLPAGRKYQRNQGSFDGPTRGVTILDCLWSEDSQQFYILDILCWNSIICTDYDTECRLFFLKSKLEEVTGITEKSEANPFPFTPLQFFPAEDLPTVMSLGQLPFPEKVDGLLFFHKQTFYIYESTNPLCLWIHLSKVPEMLGVDVSPELLAKEREAKPPRPRRGKGGEMEVADG